MKIDLNNRKLSLCIDTTGAEMKSLKLAGEEYLWPGSPDSWKNSSPLLFPVIGAMPESGWEWKGKAITLGNHGFARHSVFEVVEQGGHEVVLRLEDSEATRDIYPFPFILEVSYRLNDSSVSVGFSARNPGSEELLFSLGAHPGFLCPLEMGLDFSDYHIQFNRSETISRRIKDDFLTGEEEPSLNDQDRLVLDYSLFDRCALIYSGLRSDSVVLGSDKSERSVRMDFAGFPHFGIWTIAGKRAPYVCLEPWYGIDSTEGDSRDFGRKEGLIQLEAGREFRCEYRLTLS